MKYVIIFFLLFPTLVFAGTTKLFTDEDLNDYKPNSSAENNISTKSDHNKVYISESELTTQKKREAWDLCIIIIKVHLKTPSVAKFSPDLSTPEQSVIRKDNYNYFVGGKVDSQNSYGAMMRSSFICNASLDEQGHWHIDSNYIY